jgi:lipopolysaccharide/colanic/teichoic acid biosynthesis glycosyltransferase
MRTRLGGGEQATRRDRLYRALDLSWAACAIVFVLPLLAFLVVLVASEGGRPVFVRYRYNQQDASHRRLLKFRTQSRGCQRSRLGSSLHTTGLDLLPALFDVFAGDLPICGRYSWRQVITWLGAPHPTE